MKTVFAWSLLLFLTGKQLTAQSMGKIAIGEKIPPITIKNVYQNPGVQISFQQLKGKLIIIDFWNSWCGTCIEGFPDLERLQQQFSDRIRILLVTSDPERQVEKLFSHVRQPSLPIITDDSILNRFFPHNSVPHHVWIDKEGSVQYITDGYNAVADNISKFLEGRDLALHYKNESPDFHPDSSLLEETAGSLYKDMIGYSIALHKIEEYGGNRIAFSTDSIQHTTGFKLLNIPLLDAYKMAWAKSIYTEGGEFRKNNRVVLLTRDSNNFKYPARVSQIPAWESQNIISYESKWPLKSQCIAYLFLQKDLNELFPYQAGVEERETPYYALLRTKLVKRIKNTNPRFVYNDTLYDLQNMPLSDLVQSLNDLECFEKRPVISPYPSDLKISLTLHGSLSDFKTLQAELKKNGFQLRKKRGKLKMLVVRDK